MFRDIAIFFKRNGNKSWTANPETHRRRRALGGRDAWRDALPTWIAKCIVWPCHSSKLGLAWPTDTLSLYPKCFAEHRPGSILHIAACILPPDLLWTYSQGLGTMATHPAPSAKRQAPCSLTWPPFAMLHLSASRIRSPRHCPVEWALGQFPGSSGWLTNLVRHSHSAGTPT